MDMLYFGDTVPYAYPQGYKQGGYCDFNSTCTYPGVAAVPNTACRFSSVPSSYGSYALPPGACNGFFARKPTRIKGKETPNSQSHLSYLQLRPPDDAKRDNSFLEADLGRFYLFDNK
ncbi:hypothetical protein FSP39_000219 [Pinctada imbricata]|uniref:Uncharacterized protein n=1 Tax=Pinctada imbricata TaxID=66713 RepID=A0AA88Y410_PINIB|nr:hypothetical protein FSP39_000219 [Pinctada imbricata]